MTNIKQEFYNTKEDIIDWLIHHCSDITGIELQPDPIYGYVVNASSVDFKNQDLKTVPVKFGKIKGIFNCSKNKLTNLKFAPNEVDTFIGNFNKFKSLNGSPQFGRIFDFNHNQLTTLKGAPKKLIGKDCSFSVIGNQLKSLQYCPDTNQGDLLCSYNQLESLEYCHFHVRTLDCSNNKIKDLSNLPIIEKDALLYGNKLTSLQGFPKHIKGDCNFSDNRLTSLKYGPEIVQGYFNCSENRLTTLKYGPKEVGFTYICGNNQLQSLQYCPQEIKGIFECSNNLLSSLEYCPRTVQYDFRFKDNLITQIKEFPESVGGYIEWQGNNLPFVQGKKFLKFKPFMECKKLWDFENQLEQNLNEKNSGSKKIKL